MKFLRTDRKAKHSLIVLVLIALAFSPFASAGSDFMLAEPIAASASAGKCEKMQEQDMSPPEQLASSCCDQSNDCQTHCVNLVLSHLPVSALLDSFIFQPHPVASLSMPSSQIRTGIVTSLDPRPPRV